MLAQAVPREPADALTLDAAGLQRFDTSALAVLLECRRIAQTGGRGFAVATCRPRRWPRCMAWTACSSAHRHRYHDRRNDPQESQMTKLRTTLSVAALLGAAGLPCERPAGNRSTSSARCRPTGAT